MEDQILKHVCKFCKKKFACGRSLGGHIRCHLPKPEKSRATSSLSFKTETETLRLIKVNKGNATRSSLAGSNSHSSTSDVADEDQQEEVDVALCLIKLSKDVGPWGGSKNLQRKCSKKKRKRVEKVQVKETVFTAMKSKHDEQKFVSVVNCPSTNPDEEQFELSECYDQIVTETSPSSENLDMLDLNLPPAVIVQKESHGTVTIPHWWIENPHKHEALLSLISN